ncbi:MAG: beta-1,6-N-acetylglucosaminyltransferase [Chitinophagaceae bacterium]
MKIAHLILAHKNPLQLERIIKALEHPLFDFYIHIDKKADIDLFTSLAEKENVFFIKNRAKINWAGYGTIQATLNGFNEILPFKYEYVNVISAQDFPLKPSEYIYQYIKNRKGQEFITCESIEDEWKEAAIRVKNYHFVDWKIPGKYRLAKFLTKILPPRKFPLNFKIVGRSNWFTLTYDAAQYILDFTAKHPEVVRYFKYCWGADEFFFATILYNSNFKEKITNNLVFVDWQVEEKNGHPKILTIKDFEALKTSDKLFARKFDMITDNAIIDKIERELVY